MEPEVQKLLDDLRADYKALHETVEAKARDAAKGVVDPLIQSKLDRINKAINEKETKRDEALRAIEARLGKLALSAQQPGDDAGAKALDQFNREIRAVTRGRATEQSADGFAEYRAAFGAFLRNGFDALQDVHKRAMSIGSDPDGGYAVMPEVSSRIVQRRFERSPMRAFAAVQAIGSDKLKGLRDTDSANGGWVAEAGARSDSTTPQLGEWSIPVHELYAQPSASQSLVEDANIDIAAWLATKTADKFARLEAAAFVTGTGVGQPRGFASYSTAATADASRSWGTFEHVAVGGSSFGTDPNGVQKLIAVIHKLNPAYLPGAAFYCNRNTLSTIRQLTDASSAGQFVFVPSFQAGMPDTLLGYPVRVLVDMADIASNALAVAFGDMAECYQIADRVGFSTLVDPYTNKPFVRYYSRARVGGDVVNFDAVKFLKFA